MHFLFKFIPVISSTCFEQINYSTLIVLAAIQRECMINAIDCMYGKLPPEVNS